MHYIRLLKFPSSLTLSASREGASTTALDNLVPCTKLAPCSIGQAEHKRGVWRLHRPRFTRLAKGACTKQPFLPQL